MIRARSKLRPEISNVQYDLDEDKSTRNAIFIVRMISERAIEMRKDFYLCFIDQAKAFDKVKLEQLLNMIDFLDIDGKDLRTEKFLSCEQTAAATIDNEISLLLNIKRESKQGCGFFNQIYSISTVNTP